MSVIPINVNPGIQNYYNQLRIPKRPSRNGLKRAYLRNNSDDNIPQKTNISPTLAKSFLLGNNRSHKIFNSDNNSPIFFNQKEKIYGINYNRLPSLSNFKNIKFNQENYLKTIAQKSNYRIFGKKRFSSIDPSNNPAQSNGQINYNSKNLNNLHSLQYVERILRRIRLCIKANKNKSEMDIYSFYCQIIELLIVNLYKYLEVFNLQKYKLIV